MNNENNELDPNVKYSLILITFENGVGSLLHFFKVPLAGHALSINQIGILSRLTIKSKSKDSAIIASTSTSIIKSLGPVGKKLTPMLAILSQGLLFSLPLYIFGINYFAIFSGVILSSLWAFIQPVLILYLFLGKNFVEVLNYILKDLSKYIENIENYLIIGTITFIFIKVVLAIFYSYKLMNMTDSKFDYLQLKVEKINYKRTPKKFKFSFYFFFSLILGTILFYYQDSSLVNLVWIFLRPIAIGISIYYLVKIISIKRISKILLKLKLNKIATVLQKTENQLSLRK